MEQPLITKYKKYLFALAVLISFGIGLSLFVSRHPNKPDASTATMTRSHTFVTLDTLSVDPGPNVNQQFEMKLILTLPDGNVVKLPVEDTYWNLDGTRSINIRRTFELPEAFVRKDAFHMQVEMVRKGVKILPCVIAVDNLQAFDRTYVCHTDFPRDSVLSSSRDQVRESIKLRIFTDRKFRKRGKDA